MALVKVKEKYQVTLPAEIRKKAGLTVGDLLEAKVEGKKITLAPKVVVDRRFIERYAISRHISACEFFPGGGRRTSAPGRY